MLSPVRGDVFIGAVVVALIGVLAFPIHPLIAISFEVGLIVGILLHSSHTCAAAYHNCIDIGECDK